MNVNSTCDSSKYKILTVCLLLIVIQFTTINVANAGTASIDVQVDEIGRIHVSGSGTFSRCAPPNDAGGGQLQMFINGQTIGTGYDSHCYTPYIIGSASFDCLAVPFTQTFTSATYTVGALDCTGYAYASYTLNLDMHPIINSLVPSGNVSLPLNIVATATFKPMGWSDWYGNLSCGYCVSAAACSSGNAYYNTVTCNSSNCTCRYELAELPGQYTNGYIFASTYTGGSAGYTSQMLPITVVPAQNQSDSEKGNDNACK